MDPKFDEWCILELFGHRKLAGKLSEAEIGGGIFLRIDIPGKDGVTATQFYSPQAVYSFTPTTEAMARAYAVEHQPEPVTKWELPRQKALEMGGFVDCPSRYSCTKGLMCQDCEVYVEAMQSRDDQDESP